MKNYCLLLLLIPVWTSVFANQKEITWDANGYIMYCPCMGRFGNQAEQFLGALRFAKNLNRTMVLPPWVAYDSAAGTSFTPYDYWFDVTELKKFHHVILMRDFMKHLAPEHWPDDGKSRKIYCPTMSAKRSPDSKSCPAKIGNPFAPFWDNFNIDFTGGSVLYSSEHSSYSPSAWKSQYPAEKHPVVAFLGAPGAFPILEQNRILQKYVKWSDKIATITNNFIKGNLKRPFVGIHLRNGMDWVRACEHISDAANHFMGSPQCVGYSRKSAVTLTHEMCLPSKETIVDKVLQVASMHNTTQLYIATDDDAMIQEFANTPLKVVRYHEDYPILDLAILTAADAFIGNCVSTFTSFVVRHREVRGLPNYFFAFELPHPKIIHEDL